MTLRRITPGVDYVRADAPSRKLLEGRLRGGEDPVQVVKNAGSLSDALWLLPMALGRYPVDRPIRVLVKAVHGIGDVTLGNIEADSSVPLDLTRRELTDVQRRMLNETLKRALAEEREPAPSGHTITRSAIGITRDRPARDAEDGVPSAHDVAITGLVLPAGRREGTTVAGASFLKVLIEVDHPPSFAGRRVGVRFMGSALEAARKNQWDVAGVTLHARGRLVSNNGYHDLTVESADCVSGHAGTGAATVRALNTPTEGAVGQALSVPVGWSSGQLSLDTKIGVRDVLNLDAIPGLGTAERKYAFAAHYDFVISKREGGRTIPVMALEVDDRSHDTPDGRRRDDLKNRVTQLARLPLLRVPDRMASKEVRHALGAVVAALSPLTPPTSAEMLMALMATDDQSWAGWLEQQRIGVTIEEVQGVWLAEATWDGFWASGVANLPLMNWIGEPLCTASKVSRRFAAVEAIAEVRRRAMAAS